MSETTESAITRSYGSHFCAVHEAPEQQFSLLAPFFAEGLARGEMCLCAAYEITPEEMARGLARCGLDVESVVAQGRLSIVDGRDVCWREGRFDAEAVCESFDRSIREAVAAGFPGWRGAADLTCAPAGGASPDEIIRYEATLTRMLRGKPALVVCQYNVDRFDAHTMSRAHAVHAHSFFWGRPPGGPFVAPPSL